MHQSADSDKTVSELVGALSNRNVAIAPTILNLVESQLPENQLIVRQLSSALAEMKPSEEKAAGSHSEDVAGRTNAAGHIIGITGPPGSGKSTLLGQLIPVWRQRNKTVAVLAVDPTSRESGGSLLGDRTRIDTDPTDEGVFVRSTAAGSYLGGVAWSTHTAAQLLVNLFDIVVVETVGVGQSETAIADFVDSSVVTVQPGSGDGLQFLKAGIMEIPDVIVVTKADLGLIAKRTEQELGATVSTESTKILMVSAIQPVVGIIELADALEQHRAKLDVCALRLKSRRLGALSHFTTKHGTHGLDLLGGGAGVMALLESTDPVAPEYALVAILEQRMSNASGRS